jgi:hypothetical protein
MPKKSPSLPGNPAPIARESKEALKSKSKTSREVVYKSVGSKLCVGDNPFTAAMAKELLGWQAESENIKFGKDFLLVDDTGAKVRCYNNIANRPLYRSQLALLKQEHLRKRWKLNGEPIIIGKTGLVLNGQHQMISLVLAVQTWEKQRGLWKDYWSTEPTMEKVVTMGIEETDDVANTMDTCKSRTFTDVVFRSHYFADSPLNERKALSRIANYAVRLLWTRTGASEDAYGVRITHSELLGFIARHPKLLGAVKHIHEENSTGNSIGRFLSPGAAAGLLYLMATSSTDREKDSHDGYAQVAFPSEEQLDFSRWNKACEFWVLVAAGSAEFRAINTVRASMGEEGKTTLDECCSLMVNAWLSFIAKEPLTTISLALSYLHDKNGYPTLSELPTLGGIDIGKTEPVD